MGNGLASKLVYYWIFVIGGLTFTYLLKLVTEGKDFIIMMISLTLVYWGLEFMKSRKRKRTDTSNQNSRKANGSSRTKR